MSTPPHAVPSKQTPPNASAAVFGLQWGDEGKGKAVDLLAAEYDGVVRDNGGANAGHSVVVKGERFSLHLVPSGILYPGKAAVIGNGVVVDPEKLIQELDGLAARGVDTSGLVVSDRAHVVAPYHKAEDEQREEILKTSGDVPHELGTTRRGIGPCYAEKVQRSAAIRMGDLLRPEVLRFKLGLAKSFKSGRVAEFEVGTLATQMEGWGGRLAPTIRDTVYLLHGMLDQGKRLLFEGANATLLDVDHGTYPFVTGSSTSALGISAGTGVSERRLSRVLGVMKAYSTRVGRGPMPTELKDPIGDGIRERGNEYGTTTRRPRRVGWQDLVAVKYAAMLNEPTGLVLTMLDVLAGIDQIKVCTAYRVGGKTTERFLPDSSDLEHAEPVYQTFAGFANDLSKVRRCADLPDQARRYVAFIEDFVGVPIQIIGVGPGREQTILGVIGGRTLADRGRICCGADQEQALDVKALVSPFAGDPQALRIVEQMRRVCPKADPMGILPDVHPIKIPRHIAIIMDGNGRWAQERGFPREFGHRNGARAVRDAVEECGKLGVEALTLYSFSMENWKRPKQEIDALMTLCLTYLDGEREAMVREGIRLKVIGRREGLPPEVVAAIEGVERATAASTGPILCLAINYASRAEIVDATRALAREVQAGRRSPESIDEQAIAGRLYTADLGDLAEPDLLIRTAGEMRISNFMLWQISYSELHITDVLWPDFSPVHLRAAIRDFAGRRRRFGGLDSPDPADSPARAPIR